MSWMKEGLSQQPQPTWRCLPVSFVTEPEKNILLESTVASGCQSALQQPVWRELRLASHLPPIPPALFTRSVLQRCQEKPQATLENRRETLLRIQQRAEWDDRAWSAPFWKSNRCTPWITWHCEIGCACPRVFHLFQNLLLSLLQLFPFLSHTFYWNITSALPVIIPVKAFDKPFNIWGHSMDCPGPFKEFTPMGLRNDQMRFTVILYMYRKSQSLSNLSQISITGSLAGY